jgi:uncharacterized protein (DUF58 family)
MIQELHYRISWRAGGQRPGAHRGAAAGPGHEFIGHAPLVTARDPRRLDVRASLTDPLAEWKVRVFRQRSAVPVWLVADLSASMGFAGHRRKLDVLADFAASLGYSAWRTGDAFGFLACDGAVRPDLSLPATRRRGAGPELAERLRALQPEGAGAGGLLEAPRHLARARALVFLVSDFHFPLDFARRVLEGFSRHDLVPVVLWDPEEYRHLPRFGLVTLRDPETGAVRTLLMRRSLRERIARGFAARRSALEALFRAAGRPPLSMEHGFHADRVTNYFHRGAEPAHHAA